MSADSRAAAESGEAPAEEFDPERTRPADGVESGESLLVGPDSEVEPAISVVMPTMNEEGGIAECIERVYLALEETGLHGEIIVSDASTDRTPEIAREMGAIVVEPDRPGYGYAYRYAFDHCRGQYVVMGDADTTYDFAAIPQLLEKVAYADADIAMGSRLNGEIEDGAMPALHRYVGNPLLTAFLNLFYDAGVSDAHSGFRVFDRDVLEVLDLSADGMEFASEMVMDAAARDLDIAEVPITYGARTGEAKLESFRDGWRHVRFMLLNAPGYLFTVPGMLMTAAGALVMLGSLTGVTIAGTGLGIHSTIAGALFTLVGFTVTGMGVIATAGSDPIRRADDPITELALAHLSPERGVALGGVVAGLGGAYGVWMVGRWVASGFSALSYASADVVAMVAIVLGLQLAFGGFLLRAIASDEC